MANHLFQSISSVCSQEQPCSFSLHACTSTLAPCQLLACQWLAEGLLSDVGGGGERWCGKRNILISLNKAP